MDEDKIQVFSAETLNDVFYHIKTVAGLKITGSCTKTSPLPEKLLSTCSIKELTEITRKENYIETGAAVTLGKLTALGNSKLPKVLYEAITSIATPHIRNIATVGGNVCLFPVRGTLFAPLLALDAGFVLQNEEETLTVPAVKFLSVPNSHVLTKIRIPTEDWDISEFHRAGASHHLLETSSSYAFLANAENDILTKIRFAFSGLHTFRSISLENKIEGSRLPLEEKSVSDFIKDAGDEFDKIFEEGKDPSPVKKEFLRFVAYSLKKLS